MRLTDLEPNWGVDADIVIGGIKKHLSMSAEPTESDRALAEKIISHVHSKSGCTCESCTEEILSIVAGRDAETKALKAERDELLAACKEALSAIDDAYAKTGFVRAATSTQRLRIEAAIARAENIGPKNS